MLELRIVTPYNFALSVTWFESVLTLQLIVDNAALKESRNRA
jgi:hypothetical protein